MGTQLLRTTVSICPECLQTIDAEIIFDEKTNWVLMRKSCEKHGEFVDKIAIDPTHYQWKSQYSEQIGSLFSTTPQNVDMNPPMQGCPYDCGLCQNHLSAANLMIIDVTNRCNLNCPICFANSNKQGRLVEYSLEEIERIMKHFIRQRPYHAVIAQFSGGEPTLHPQIIEILKKAKEIGFPHMMLNTNGIKMAKDLDFCRQVKEAGCGAFYLSWDAASSKSPEVYKKTRGMDLTKIKHKFIENCRTVGLDGIMLVCTIAKGVNEDEVGPIMDYARENNDVIAGVIFQPVSLCGRVSLEDLMTLRYTGSDLMQEIKRWSNGIIDQFYPLTFSSKLTQLLTWFSNLPGWSISSHDDCGWATFAPIQNKQWIKLTDLIDIDGFTQWANQCWDMVEKRQIPQPSKMVASLRPVAEKAGFQRLFDAVSQFTDTLSDISYRNLMKVYFISGALKYVKNFEAKKIFSDPLYKYISEFLADVRIEKSKQMLQHGLLFVGCMHFQDVYDLDIARVQRCVVHYGVLDPSDPQKVLQIPFCTFNTIHRERIEKEWAAKHAKPFTPEIIDLKEDLVVPLKSEHDVDQ